MSTNLTGSGWILFALLFSPPIDGDTTIEAPATVQDRSDSRAQDQKTKRRERNRNARKNRRKRSANKQDSAADPDFGRYAIYRKTAPRAEVVEPATTRLPLELKKGDRIAFIGNTLLERLQHFGYVEAILQQKFPEHELVFRNLCWPADTPDLQPRPANFADTEQHLTHEKIDVIFAAYGFNESFAGADGLKTFRESLTRHVADLRSKAFNGESAPKVVLISPIANENVTGVAAADLNNERIKAYARVVEEVAADQSVAFVDVFKATEAAMATPESDLTFNGCHLNDAGYRTLSEVLVRNLIGSAVPKADEQVRRSVIDKNRQFFRRFRPVNTYYYTGGRNKAYGYLDFLPAMRNFEIMVENRDRRIWDAALGKKLPERVDDSNVPPLPSARQSRGANKWMSAADEYKAFKIDPRFEVSLFAGEEEFPDIAAPIQMRWDGEGRLWVSCSTTYPHVYPGNEPNDKLVILEDTDKDGKADKSTVFADDLHIPLSFVLGDGGVYVSEEPHLTFLKDTDGDGKADLRRILLTGFGCEDSHHALHDFTWTPDGDLLFRESVFHHSQVETPYGPVRQQNSGWFVFEPKRHRLTSFGTYSSTNPWGVTFDHWGQHVASHPIYAAAFHSLDPAYPQQHSRPAGLRAYSGTCGQEFIDFDTFPEDLQGHFVKVRYKPTNRVELHQWIEGEFGWDEKHVGDIIFSSNLSFIPVDLQWGPRGALYVCDWYNPVKGHAQYSLRDDRRDRHSGRIWRITAKENVTKRPPTQEPPKVAGASIDELLELHKRKEYRYRYWAKRELRSRDAEAVATALDAWVERLDSGDPEFRHHQLEAVWIYRTIDAVRPELLRELLGCENRHARAAATQQLRYWHGHFDDAARLLRRSANDPNAVVRMQAAIAASYIGTPQALDAILDVANHPRGGHLAYAFKCALESHTLKRHWEGNPSYAHVSSLIQQAQRKNEFVEQDRTAAQAVFDGQENLAETRIGCVPERMKYTIEGFTVKPGQPVKLVFYNPDATDHNLVIVQPNALEEVGVAANDMAKDPANAESDFIPADKKHLIVAATPMIGPTRKSKVHVLRFKAPAAPGVYPYVCTFPGHWIVMVGDMVVADDPEAAEKLLAARARPTFVKEWKLSDFEGKLDGLSDRDVMRGMKAFRTARCHQCHAVRGHGATFGPDLTNIAERYRGADLLMQILEPSRVVDEQFRTQQFIQKDGSVIAGAIVGEDENSVRILTNPINPQNITTLEKKRVLQRLPSTLSTMPEGMLSGLTKEEILDLLGFLEAGGYKLPEALEKKQGTSGGCCESCDIRPSTEAR